MELLEPPVKISDILEIKTGGAFGGLGVALYVIYKSANQEKSLKIYSKNFSKKTIDAFLNDIVKRNPAIQIQK